ncbi:phosphoribosylglycinamide formyltransferase [Photobacterium carnosum]|uniref:Phosphoribosylglycinamide formyltransferase n=1 Tax=Photobacterium carnosum TaxID=2023717 RepID=A0A2N4UV43_9GAMM|nr:RelA/SpoT domain-containing protein [Photobacterium carnosum]MBY3787398.1 RelA/SpoT domain-containing protein [Photobacterium carnosum]MCD9521870.1 phosphoribosylglycinamide formyltransferase [Photobacterium carnosum]MCD9525446.1 phosphoribosylglycinamide formyltransferase [Photobacterium carnosum]MCD9532030.1 phosphoribosylglycinamide formyltransferase [Photobacterium carnosum]MCD9536310.1 phosphoribosylglycinamide formyltransferase [Photobacterium carnosum]
MNIKSVLRTSFVLFCMLSRTVVAAPAIAPAFNTHDQSQTRQTQASRKAFQRDLSGLYSIQSWRDDNLRQPFNNFDALYLASTTAQIELQTLLQSVSLASATNIVIPKIKSAQRSQQKIATELQGETDKITDIARGSIIANDIPTLVQAYELLAKEATIVSVKNRFKNPTPSGYRDLNVLVRLPHSQIITEVQLHLNEISTIKNGPEHDLYEKIQHIERLAQQQQRSLSEFEAAQIKQLRQQSHQLYQTAWLGYLQPQAA